MQSETNLVPNFIENLKDDGKQLGLTFQIVERGSADIDYQIFIMQETTLGSAAAAVLVLDRGGNIVTSVVRSGRISGKGAIRNK